jgi:putative ABC transport system ATP-binding protein
MLKLVNVHKQFTTGEVRTAALNGVSLSVQQGEFVAITGPSGCGKSTLLGVIGMLDSLDAGEYWFKAENVAKRSERALSAVRRGRIGFIFQSFNLIEELSVFENVELALAYSDVPPAERGQRVTALLQQLGVAHRASHRVAQLSGGQQQRVAIARALVSQPDLLLADEPTGNLDSAHGDEVMRLLKEINEAGTTVVMVTHSPAHAALAGRVIEMIDGAVRLPAQEHAA